jgi:hypothetical protein
MQKEIKLESINLKIGDKEIELSIEEAKNLYNELDKLFTNKTIYTPLPYYPEKDWTQPPVITYTGSHTHLMKV